MGAKKTIGKIFACIFTIVFAILCLSFVYVFMVRNIATYEHVSSYVSDANIFDCSSYEILPRKDASTLREAIGKDLFEIGIPRLVVDDILDSDEVHKIITDYTYGYIRYIIYNESKPVFATNDFIKVVENKYYLSEKKGLSEEQKTEVTKYVIEFAMKLDKGTFDKSELNEIVNIDTVRLLLTSVSSKLALIILSCVLLLMLVLVSICLRSLIQGIRWCAKAVLVDGVILIITSLLEVRVLIMFVNSKGMVDSLFISVIENQFGSLVACGIGFIILGVIFLIITGILLKKQKRKNSDVILDNVISDEVGEAIVQNETQVEPISNIDDSSNDESETAEEPVKEENEVTSSEDGVSGIESDVERVVDAGVGIADAVTAKEEDEVVSTNDAISDIESEIEEPVSESVKPEVTEEPSKEENDEVEAKVDASDDSFDLMEIVDTFEDVSTVVTENNEPEIAIETPITSEEPVISKSEETSEYTEISDEKEEEIVKEDIKVNEPTSVELNVIHPVRGADIKVEPEEEEEDIEIL